ncbi:MAG: patatin-like phospholipase family protein [Myxococcota bacterium]
MPLLLEKLREEPFSLALSSGFFGFYAHAGLLSALEDHGLTPSLVTGSSAGALAGGLWAAGVSAQTMSRVLCELERRDFWDPGVGLGLLRGRLFRERLEKLLPVSAIEDAGVPLAISVFDILGRRTVVRKRGSVAAAIHASCALPGLFHPVWLERRPYSDGGILDRPGWLGLDSETFTLAHHLPSRGNRPLTRRPRTTVVTVRELPLVTPFSLRRGNEAFATARRAAQKALATAIADVLTV